MIDVSDGLALDLHRLADASGVGFELGDVPVAEGATLEEALSGGEDYELLLTVPPSDQEALEASVRGSGIAPAGAYRGRRGGCRRIARCEVRRWPGWAGSTRWAEAGPPRDQLLALGW